MIDDTKSQEKSNAEKLEAAFYIDAFNLYYGIVNLKKPYLKWLNIWKMCEILIPKRSERLVKVVFCSAYNKKDFDKMTRHQKYVRALRFSGVCVPLGHYSTAPRDCHACGHTWDESEEKETDVNVGIHLISDAHENVFHHAYLMSADSDQAATSKMFAERFPDKVLTNVTPPTKRSSEHILRHNGRKEIKLSEAHLERSLFPRGVSNADGSEMVVRPPEYDPPPGWAPPKI